MQMKGMLLALLCSVFSPAALAQEWKAGEQHGTTALPSAGVRDAQQRDTLRFTVWYPAPASSNETPLTIGAPDAPLFDVGRSAIGAPIAGDRLPTLLLSHGNGGSARMMGWLGTALARAGYLVIAVDHPGNNGVDELTLAGSLLTWLRADDLQAALAAVQADPRLGQHVDAQRLGVVGFSAGGYTALLAAGARPELQRLLDFCTGHPDDGVCRPQQEATTHTLQARLQAAASPQLQPYTTAADQSRAIHGIRAVYLLAPAIVQAFAPAQLQALQIPVAVVLGNDDVVAPAATNGEVVAAQVHGATLQRLAGVGHYDFLARCTPLGEQRMGALCSSPVSRARTHREVRDGAITFFARALQ
ncbi:alpha/beta hydrolase family protein [Stenotrophomonas sp. NPDC077659]|uniref:alpha/beta hydrolase family protein n=1 Tax=Stenotrophomonas sp. NPDC077659 TaxID=3390694 RepID=UPI003D032DE0